MKHLTPLIALMALTAALTGFGQDTRTDAATTKFQALFQKMQAKVEAGKTNEADLKEELDQLDPVIAEEKGASTEKAAEMVYSKAMVYVQVFQNFDQGEQIIRQMKIDYPATKPGLKADDIVASIERAKAAKKIQDGLLAGTLFPDFSEKDLDGNPISVSGFKGKVVLVDFWATWCAPCRRELPNVIATYKKHHADGFEIIGVSLDSDRGRLATYLKQTEGMVWPQYYDGMGWKNKLAMKYAIEAIPNNFLVGPDGKIIGKSLTGENLEDAVATALAKK